MESSQSDDEAAYIAGKRLGEAAAKAHMNELTVKQVKAIARDILPENPILLNSALYTFSQPGFAPLLSVQSIAIRRAHKASLVHTLEEIFAPRICSQLCSLLDGFLGLERSRNGIYSHNSLGDLPVENVSISDKTTQSSSSSEDEINLRQLRLLPRTAMPARKTLPITNKWRKACRGIQLPLTVASVLLAAAGVLTTRDTPTTSKTKEPPESIDCKAKRHALEQIGMALPPYRTTNDDIFFTQQDGEVKILSPWEASG